MVALREQQFQDHQPILAQLFGIGLDLHAFGNNCNARGQQAFRAGYFHQAHPASRNVVRPFQMAKRRDVDSRISCCFQDCFTFLGPDMLAIDGESFYSHINFRSLLIFDSIVLVLDVMDCDLHIRNVLLGMSSHAGRISVLAL